MLVQLPGRLFELLILEQPPHQFLTGIGPVFLIGDRLIGRKQHLGFNLEQGGRHHEKFPRDSQIQVFHRLDIGEVLLGNEMDGNVVNIDLALLDKMEQEIKGPFKVLDANLIGQLGLFGGVKIVIHRPIYTRLREAEQAFIY